MYKHTFSIMGQYDPKFEVCYVSYTHDFVQYRRDIGSSRVLVSFYWQSAIQASYAGLLKAAVGHIVFRHAVTSICTYVTFVISLTNV